MKFSSEQQLQEFLGLLDSDYRKYAAALWGYGVTSANQLSTGSVDTLIAAGISNRLHAENIKSLCGRAGAVTGGAAEAADRSLVSSESFQQGMSSLRAALSEQRKQLLEEQQKALEAQKREILESLGTGIPTWTEAILRLVGLLTLAALAGTLDWQPWRDGDDTKFPWASFVGNLVKATPSGFALLPTRMFLSEECKRQWYERIQWIFKS